MLTAVQEKNIVSFIIIFGKLSVPILFLRVAVDFTIERLCSRVERLPSLLQMFNGLESHSVALSHVCSICTLSVNENLLHRLALSTILDYLA